MDINDIRIMDMEIGKPIKHGRDMLSIKKTKVVQGNPLNGQDSDMKDVHFIHCSFVQDEPFTKLKFEDCVFEGCNLVNCELDASNEIIDCNTSQRKITKNKDTLEQTVVAYNRHTKEIIKTSKFTLEEGQ